MTFELVHSARAYRSTCTIRSPWIGATSLSALGYLVEVDGVGVLP